MDIKEYIPLNFELMKNPLNWIIVFLMIAIAGLGLAFVMQSFSGRNSSENGKV